MNPTDPQTPQQMPPAQTPPVAPQPQTMAPAPGPMPTQGKSKKNLIIIFVVAALVVAAAVAFGVYSYVSNTPENLVKAAVQNLSKEKQLAADITMVNGTGASAQTFNGDVALSVDPSNQKNGELILGLGKDNTHIGANLLSLDGTLYFSLSNAQNLGALMAELTGDSTANSSSLSTALKSVNGVWFEVTKDQVQAIAQSSGSDTVAASPTPEDLKKVLEIYDQHPFVKTDKTYADEAVDGSNSAHFSVKIDRNQEVAFLQALKAANLSTIKVTDDDINTVRNASDTNNSTLELWIARDSHKFKKIVLENKASGEEAKLTVNFKSQLPTFDKFQKPSGTHPIEDFFPILLSVAGGTTSTLR